MKILIALPVKHPQYPSIDEILAGAQSCSGTVSSIVRSAQILQDLGHDVTLCGKFDTVSMSLKYLRHDEVVGSDFEQVLAHQSHWDGQEFTFGVQTVRRSKLTIHNETSWSFGQSFFEAGGLRLICVSGFQAERYRALRDWNEKVSVVYNSFNQVFHRTNEASAKRLLFVGAITPTKGFRELMLIWSYIVKAIPDIDLAIAGSIGVHSDVPTGPLGIAEPDFERNEIVPWLETLPADRKPELLGALSPHLLNEQINRSSAVIVNPSWRSPETFCISAVEARSCARTVFSIEAGGLVETVYRGELQSLSRSRDHSSLASIIVNGFKSSQRLDENGRLAMEFVQDKFSVEAISKSWSEEVLVQGPRTIPLGNRSAARGIFCDFLRRTGNGISFEKALAAARNL